MAASTAGNMRSALRKSLDAVKVMLMSFNLTHKPAAPPIHVLLVLKPSFMFF